MNLIADRIGLPEPIQETEMLMYSAHEPILGDRDVGLEELFFSVFAHGGWKESW